MLKRFFSNENYQKIGSPNLTHIMFFTKAGKKIYGKVALVDHHKKRNHVYLGIIPFR